MTYRVVINDNKIVSASLTGIDYEEGKLKLPVNNVASYAVNSEETFSFKPSIKLMKDGAELTLPKVKSMIVTIGGI